MYMRDVIHIEGQNMVITKDYINKKLLFYPYSEAKWPEHNIKLANKTDEFITILYNEAWYIFESGLHPNFYELESELLGDEIIGR